MKLLLSFNIASAACSACNSFQFRQFPNFDKVSHQGAKSIFFNKYFYFKHPRPLPPINRIEMLLLEYGDIFTLGDVFLRSPHLILTEFFHRLGQLQRSICSPLSSRKFCFEIFKDIISYRMISLELMRVSNKMHHWFPPCFLIFPTWNLKAPAARWFLVANSTLTKFLKQTNAKMKCKETIITFPTSFQKHCTQTETELRTGPSGASTLTVTLPEYWPLIGPDRSCDLNTGPLLVAHLSSGRGLMQITSVSSQMPPCWANSVNLVNRK